MGETKPESNAVAVATLPLSVPVTKSLAQKILEIQDRVGVVKKRGNFDSAMGGGHYLRIEDAVVAVNKLLTQHKLILTGDIKNAARVPHERVDKSGNLSRSGYISSVEMEWTVEDVESGERRVWTFPGDGYDATDKAIYKAMTGSRKYAIINIFNLPIGNDVEEHGTRTWDEAIAAQKAVVKKQLVAATASEHPAVRQIALEGLDSQLPPPASLILTRPEEYNGHFFIASGLIAIPQLDQFFEDTGSKRLNSKKTGRAGWKVPAEYEKGLLDLCGKLKIEIEG
jgi:hypothetical protein